MKYLMGLIVSFTLVVGSYAQDVKDNLCGDEGMEEGFSKNEAQDNAGMFGVEIDESTTMYNSVGEDESAYYIDDPKLREDIRDEASNADAKVQDDASGVSSSEADRPKATEPASTNTEAAEKNASVFDFPKECSLKNILNSREGKFKVKHEMDNGELKVEREKDGEGTIKYESPNEYYNYEEEEDGRNEYTYGITKDNEVIEIVKNEDGSADVFYQGHFNSLDEAKALENGLNFEGVESACRQ